MEVKGMEEVDKSPVKEKHNLGVFQILQEAVVICSKSTKFLVFTLVTYLPLFFFSVYYEFLFQRILADATIAQVSSYQQYNLQQSTQLGTDFFQNLIQLLVLYLVPLQLLELCTVLVTVTLASKIHAEGRAVTFKDLACTQLQYKRLKHTLITLIYVVCWSTCTLFPLIWFVINYYASFYSPPLISNTYDSSFEFEFEISEFETSQFETSVPKLFFALASGVGYIIALGKYLEWSAVWNISIVQSILEEKVYGIGALALSFDFIRASKQQGALLMLGFFAWGIGIRLPSLYAGCYKGGYGIWVQVGFFCGGNVVKWVSCLVYFYDCKRQKAKKVDEELGWKG